MIHLFVFQINDNFRTFYKHLVINLSLPMQSLSFGSQSSVTTQQLQLQFHSLRMEDFQDEQLGYQAADRLRLISSKISDAGNSRKRELVENIKKQIFIKNEKVRLSIESRKKLDNIHSRIYAEVEGCRDTAEINYQNYLKDQNIDRTTFSNKHGIPYYEKLLAVVQGFNFLDRDLMKPLCYQLIGRQRVLIIKYYIDWSFSVEYAGLRKEIRSYWEDFKFIVLKIIDSIKSLLIDIWNKLKSAWKTLFNNGDNQQELIL